MTSSVWGGAQFAAFQHDFRTDLFLQVRHEWFLELGFIVGTYAAAREAGASAFDDPFHSADGKLFGWYREHIDDWLSSRVPWKSSPTRRRKQALLPARRRSRAGRGMLS